MSAAEPDPAAMDPATDVQGRVERLRSRLLEQLESEDDEAVLQGAELALVALREPLEPGPVTVLLRHLSDYLEAAIQRQDDELRDLRRKLKARDEDLLRLRTGS